LRNPGRIAAILRFLLRISEVVAKLRIEARQVDFVIEQMIQCVFNCAGEKLSLQVYPEKVRAGVDVFVTCHVCSIKLVWLFDLNI
jgi:hypothetical protein